MSQEDLNFKWEVVDFLKDLVIIIIIVLLIRTFIAMPFQISGQSMFSSYYDKEFIIVDRLSYLLSEPKRWDVIVFKPHVSKDKEYFLKRIIWVPGDKLKIEWWNVFVKTPNSEDFIQLDEKYLNEENNGKTYVWISRTTKQYELWKDQYFVIGDNRNHSTDSRECFSSCSLKGKTQYISKSDMTWKVFLDLWYFNFSDFNFRHPNYQVDISPKFFSSPSSYDYDL